MCLFVRPRVSGRLRVRKGHAASGNVPRRFYVSFLARVMPLANAPLGLRPAAVNR